MGQCDRLSGGRLLKFWRKVSPLDTPVDGCWPWRGSRNTKGYGRVLIGKRWRGAHRVVYESLVDDIPDGMLVMHSCDNPWCVRPSHLSVGTIADNNRDMMNKGRNKPSGARGCTHGMHKITEAQAMEIRRSTEPLAVLSERYGVAQSTVSRVRNARLWSHL